MFKMKTRKNTLWCFTLGRYKSEMSSICFVCCFLIKKPNHPNHPVTSFPPAFNRNPEGYFQTCSSKTFTLLSSHVIWLPIKFNYSALVNQYLSFSEIIKIILTNSTCITNLAEFTEPDEEVTSTVLL